MKKVLFLSLVVVASCTSVSTKEVNSDSTVVKIDRVKAVVDTLKK